MTAFDYCIDLLFRLVDAANDFMAFLNRPLLSQRIIDYLEESADMIIIGDALNMVKDLLQIANWGQVTVLWAFTAGIITVISVIFVKWILDWVL